MGLDDATGTGLDSSVTLVGSVVVVGIVTLYGTCWISGTTNAVETPRSEAPVKTRSMRDSFILGVMGGWVTN